ncbi:unnamed protein product [Lota lota]
MRKAEVQTTQKRAAADEAGVRFGGVEPPVPPKRSNTNQNAPHPPQSSPTPPVFLRKMRNAAVGTGCDIRLKVSVGGDPQPSLYWYHNDELLNMDNQEYGGLWIRDCKPSDAGLYTCIASNHLGEARSSAVLAVLDLGEDSETTDDEAGDQIETKDEGGDFEERPVRSSTSPMQSRSGSTTPISFSGRKKVAVPTDYQDTVPGEFEEKVRQPKSVGMSQGSTHDSRPQTPVSEYSSRKELATRPSPKLTRASSKVFEKVRGLEERRRSLDLPEGSISGRSWAGFNRDGSVDSDDGGSRLGISRESSREDLREALKEDAAERRSMFRQRAASLEDKPRYSQKVQDIENKFTEELQRIKKLVGKPHMKKSFSTEQLTSRGRQRQPFRKLEPIPPQVIQKLQEREQAQWAKEQKENEPSKQGSSPRSPQNLGNPPESMQLSDLPGQCSRREINIASPVREIIQRSSSPAATRALRAESLSTNVDMSLRKVERRPPSPQVQRVSRVQEPPHTQPVAPVQMSTKEEISGRKTPIEVALRRIENRPESPLVPRRPTIAQELPAQQLPAKPAVVPPVSPLEEKMEVEVTKPASKPSIPTIVVENEPAEQTHQASQIKSGKGGQAQKTKAKSRRTRPMSPELDSSDDSYVSAGEDPMEAPLCECPLQDTVSTSGTDVLLKCVIAGTPLPEVTWRRDNTVIAGSANCVLKVEGDRHSLLIKSAKPSDAGKYSVTAVNEVGKVSTSSTLVVKAGSAQEPRGNLGLPRDVSSPITSDEEYLSPLEEGLDTGQPGPRRVIDARFKEPPTFLVTMSDQTVIEGQEVTMSVRISGQPKPMLYWLRDRVTVKTGPRHVVREAEDGAFEMTIRSATRSDTGAYACKIINEYGTKQCEGRLEVKAPLVEPGLAVIRPVRDITAKAGDTVLFECHVMGPQDTDVDWLANDKLIQPALLNCKMHFDGRKCRLLLNSVHEDDSGTYVCKLSTAKEEVTSSGKLKVIPSVHPLFTRKLDVLEVIEGRNARFDCKVSGTPPPNVTWSHFDQQLSDSEDVHIVREGGRHSLIICHVTNEDEGFYTVTARNGQGEAENSAELYVQEPRPAISSQMAKLEKMPSIPEEPEVPENEVERFTMPDFIKPLYDLDVVEGKEAVLKCKVAGLPYPTIAWFHNGKRIDSTEDRKMTQFRDVHSLVIRSVCHAHGGVYKSVVSNKIGKATCYSHLYVTDMLPDPPEGAPVVEAITGKTITLSWRKPRRLDPSIEAGSLMYAIQQQALGSIQWTIIASSLKETSYTITTLSKGVRYIFRVLTITSKAFSKPSAATDPLQLLDRGPYLQECPVIMDKPDVVFVMENQSVTITVTLNHVNAVVIWRRKGVLLSSKPGLYEMGMPDDDQHTLRLLKVKSSDVGPMAFVASNKHGNDTCTFTIEMAAAPTFETIMEDLDVCVGETPRFAVVVEGKPIPDILWFKNDVLLAESSHYTFVYDDNECSLVILNTHQEDSGVYTCTARNLAGSVTCKAELTVHAAKRKEHPIEDEKTILRKMRRMTDYYEIHKEIRRGAFSYVKRVVLKVGKTEYAAKFISARAKRKASALREMNLLARLDHERILYFHDAFEKKNAVIIVTEICHEELLDRFAKKSMIMESDVRSCMRQLLEGVDYLHHQNIIHLDIKPDNILMGDTHSDQIRLCDFGNALDFTPDEAQYCKYGTPEFVAPEIVNQSPVSKATDIWPIGVIAYLCLTGVSPFAGENDRSSVLNIRNYNVAFEENMFAEAKEAKGFIIKLLVADHLRPDTQECLRHPWFKTLGKGKAVSTESLKKFVFRRKWQRSLISYKSKMVMRSIPELLNDSTSHISIAVPRNLKEGSPLPSSSSDSDEDIDELPFVPMPLHMEFSGSRVSLNDIQGNEQENGNHNGSTDWSSGRAQERPLELEAGVAEKDRVEVSASSKGRPRKRSKQENDKSSSDDEPSAEPPQRSELSRRPLRRGSSMESDKPDAGRRRGELRRGGSADSALSLRIAPEEGQAGETAPGEGRRVLKKAVSMELPRRSASPGAANMSQEDYAMKLELMRQRLLRGGAGDKKLSGLRGPLFETLETSECFSRGPRLGPPPLVRAASSECSPREDAPKPKLLCKSASFSQGDAEPIPLHRRSGAPLEIPLAQVEQRKLKEAMSMSSLTEQVKLDSRPVTPRNPSPRPQTPESVVRESPTKMASEESLMERDAKPDEAMSEKMDGLTTDSNFDERSSTSGFSEKDMSISEDQMMETEYTGQREPTPPPPPPMAQSSVIEEEMEEEKEEIMEEVEKKTVNVPEEKDKGNVEMEEEENEEKMPGESSDMIITTNSVMVTPTHDYSRVPGSVAAPLPAPTPPAVVVLPDGRRSAYASIMQTIMVPAIQPESVSSSSSPSAPKAAQGSSTVPTSTQTTKAPAATALSPPSPVPTPTPSQAPTPAEIPYAFPGRSKPIIVSSSEHPAVYSRVASPELIAKEPSPPRAVSQSLTRELNAGRDFQDITSEEVFEARFKKRESSLTRSFKFLTRSKNDDKQQAVSPDATETGEDIYRPGPIGAPLEFASRRLEEKSKSVLDLREAQKDQGFMRRLSMRLKRTPSAERKEETAKEEEQAASKHRLSWTLGRKGSQEKKEVEMSRMDGGAEDVQPGPEDKEGKKPQESPVLAMRRKIESTVAGISTRIRSFSEERKVSDEKEQKRAPIFSMLRRAASENRGVKSVVVPSNQLAAQTSNGASSESLDSMSSLKSETSKVGEVERRSRWDRWGLTRGKRDKTVSQPDIPTTIPRDSSGLRTRQYSKLASDFAPVFHIKLRDHVLLEGDPVTLSCLPAGSPHPHIAWVKDKRPLEIDARMNLISCPDGRQLLMMMQTTKKDAGLYECVATNPLGAVYSSCTISLARLPNRPGTPEIPQKYKDTALVVWRPSDNLAPCTYSLERKAERESSWLIVATGVADCYYNVVDLPAGVSFRFRVACVNKAGQGPYSNLSDQVCLDSTEPAQTSSTPVVVKTAPAVTPPVVMTSSMTVTPIKPAQSKPAVTTAQTATATPTSQTAAPTVTAAKPPTAPPAPVARSTPSPTVVVSAAKAVPPAPSTPTGPAPVPSPTPAPPSAPQPVTAAPVVQPGPLVKAKTTLNINVGKPKAKLAPPPTVLPKPKSPINMAPPPANTAHAMSPPPTFTVSAPAPTPTIGKPISSVPMYRATPPSSLVVASVTTMTTTPTPTPTTSITITPTAAPAASPVASPPVVLVSSLSPMAGPQGGGDPRGPPSGRVTPSGRATPSGRRTPLGRPGDGSLRQGVPQKPYTFMDEKARGRFGVIRECRENATGNLFMAKIVPYEADTKQAVLQEYDILKSLHHEKVMALHEAYVTPRYLVLIAECCSGKELLYSLVDRFHYSEDDMVAYIIQILQGLDYLHTRRILHLDIKPENVIVTYMNVIKIIDFGSAQSFNPLFLKQFSPPIGTLEYMSPEMVKGDVVGPPADIWSVGVLTFIMLSGRSPFMENDPQETEARILAAKFDLSKLYQNVSQSASLFLKKIICSYPWARPSIKDCFGNSWLQDAYLMRLRRQTLTFTTTRLKEFLAEQQRRRAEGATKHKVLLRSYSSTGPPSPNVQPPSATTMMTAVPTAPVT